MKRLQELLLIEDTCVPDLCHSGLRITGQASQSPFFDTFIIPPSMSGEEFFSSLKERSLRMIERVKFMAQKGDPALAKAIWEKTQKEVRKGTMGPPLTLEQVVQRYGRDFQVTPSFGLEQGVDESGAPKFRRIDDYTASGVNPSAHRMQKVPMCMVDYIGVMIRAAAENSDMASAYTDRYHWHPLTSSTPSREYMTPLPKRFGFTRCTANPSVQVMPCQTSAG